MSHNRRAAFTLVELLVVIAIIGVLIQLLLPAVQQAREAGRRTTCVNNIKQVALATLNYNDVHRRLPPAGFVTINNSPQVSRGKFLHNSGAQYSWIVMILPQIEQTQIHERFDFSTDVFSQSLDPQEHIINTLLCPSDNVQRAHYEHPSSGKRFGKGNYAAWVSPYHADLNFRFPGAISGKGRLFGEIVDGTSNTLMISEVRKRENLGDQRGAWALAWTGSTHLAFDMHHNWMGRGYANNGDVFTPWTISTITRQVQWPNNLGPNRDILYGCPDSAGAQLDGMPCDDAGSAGYLSAAPRSRHPLGVNTALVDGSVRFVRDNVDPVAFAYLIAIDDGEAVSLVLETQ